MENMGTFIDACITKKTGSRYFLNHQKGRIYLSTYYRKTMKRSILWLLILPLALSLKAQIGKPGKSAPKTFQRCATDQYLQRLLAQDPGLKARLEAAEARLARGMEERLRLRKQGNQRINAVVTIPVVVHVILPNPNIITDADVQWQINRLNTDFAGQNADSVLAGPFAASFGHSQIQFCLAQRDPKGNPTNGINRVASDASFDQNNFNELKYSSNCGADAWDTEQYFNIWVAESVDGTLGAATFPGGGIAPEQGIVIAHEGFGNNPAYVSPSFNLGRTAVHETGHFFFARHIWGDDGGCNPDFPTVSGLTGTWVDDTPTQSGPTIGCPTGTQAAGCGSPNPPGKMYQNYMDYTNDACYCMFTKNQVLRMEAALDLFRNSLTTSDKCTPALVFPNDASVAAILSPVATNGCAQPGNSVCATTLTPSIRLKNFGTANLANVVINVQIDNGTPSANNWAGNLAQNASVDVTLPDIAATPGNHTLKIYVTTPNGAGDARLSNDTLTGSFTIITPVTAPLTEGFESATFPPTGWYILNPTGSLTWERTTAAAKTGVASARMLYFDYSGGDGHVDYLLSAPIPVVANDSLFISFDRAYRLFSTDVAYADSLAVVISTDCGATFTEVWKRGGAGLATVAGTTENSFVPNASQWVNTKLNLQPYITSTGSIIVGFKGTNMYGNNLYIDNINIDTTSSVITDAQIFEVLAPSRHECTRMITPVFTLRNNGNEVLTKATIVVVLNNVAVDSIHWTGLLLPGNMLNIAGDDMNIPTGLNHNIRAYTINPNDQLDMATFNDTARKDFVIHDDFNIIHLYMQSFDDDRFDPAFNWVIDSSQSGYSWEKTTRASSIGSGSAWIRNYRFNSNGKHDDLYSPRFSNITFDSLIVYFDVAHASISPAGLPPDTLEVLLTKDCGNTFETIYKKWGADLATVSPPPSFPVGDTVGFVPTATQWRTEYINITERVNAGSKFMIVFRNTSNRGNNTFLDHVRVWPVILPERLKQNGFLIAPNPFQSQFTIRHLLVPTDLKAVIISNTAGQIVYRRQFSGNAGNYIYVDLGRYSAGMYHVKMIYTNKVVDAKLMKLN
jgi:hypothetical protein